MNKVLFPGFNLEFNISQVAFNIFGIDVYWYGIIIVFGIVLALILAKKDNGKHNIKYESIVEWVIVTLPIAIIGARIYYVIFSWSNYKNNLLEVFNFKNGGLAIYGGIIAGGIATYVFCKLKKISFLDLLDYVSPYLILAQGIGRLANFVNVEAYGSKTNLPWRMSIFENGNEIEVHPTFLYESIANIAIFVFLYKYRDKRKFEGQISLLYIILYSFIRFWIEGLRTDSLMFFNLRISQVLSFMIFVLGIITYKKLAKHAKIGENTPKT